MKYLFKSRSGSYGVITFTFDIPESRNGNVIVVYVVIVVVVVVVVVVVAVVSAVYCLS
jgi:hypothetical protein